MAKILIIDDDDNIRAVLGKFLSCHGHEVTAAADGRLGLAAALEKPDLIICDLAMPTLNGLDVLTALRRDKHLEETPFIFLSGSGTRETIRQSMNLGGDDFITKPAEASEILAAVNSRLERHRRQRQRHAEEVKKAVQIFSGITNDLGGTAAAIQWLAEAAAADQAKVPPNPVPSSPPETAATFLASKDNRRYFVKLSQVKVLLADGEYSKAFWGKDQSMMFRKALKQWEQELPPAQFVRVHRKAIINLAFLDFIEKNPSGQPQVHLKEFSPVIEVSQRKVATLNRTLKSLGRVS